MRIYRVGGSVRDELLGRPSADEDFVVVGASPEEMTARGFRAVGQDFPVFLDPQTGAEYALARTERKAGRGHRGFTFHADPSVTLEDDLLRRDLTINAMARDDQGELIDPYGGERDLRAGILRHVSPAFAEDPLRVLRVARFAARLGFVVAPETEALMRAMVVRGDLAELTAERVWQELARGLEEPRPSRMFAVLRECGALAVVLPEVDRLFGVPQPVVHHPEIDTGVHTLQAVDYAAAAGYALSVRFAALVHDLGKALTPAAKWPRHIAHENAGARLVERLAQRLRVPTECREVGRASAELHLVVQRVAELRPATLLDLLRGMDALRRPERMRSILQATECDVMSRPGERGGFAAPGLLGSARDALAAVDLAAVAAHHADKPELPQRIRQAQTEALAAWKRAALPAATPRAATPPATADDQIR